MIRDEQVLNQENHTHSYFASEFWSTLVGCKARVAKLPEFGRKRWRGIRRAMQSCLNNVGDQKYTSTSRENGSISLPGTSLALGSEGFLRRRAREWVINCERKRCQMQTPLKWMEEERVSPPREALMASPNWRRFGKAS